LNHQPLDVDLDIDQAYSNSSPLPLTENISTTEFNFDFISESVYKSTIEFVVNLHNNNNFTEVDIINIQNGIKEKIIKPIVSMLENVIDDEIIEPIKISKYHRVASVI
jgi:hypothetical protein